jgi:tRNA (guanine-N7-)-methyltransferase
VAGLGGTQWVCPFRKINCTVSDSARIHETPRPVVRDGQATGHALGEQPTGRGPSEQAPDHAPGNKPSVDATPAPSSRRIRAKGEPRFPDGPRPDPAEDHFERRIRSFQPRRSRVTAGQEDALQRLWPMWGLDIDGRRTLDLAELFGDTKPVVLEIGFGMGEATAQMAGADPDTNVLAVDVHTPGQGNLLNLAERGELSNIRVANGDAIILLREMLLPDSLDGLRAYFPDPWPKKRHHKRRLIQPEFLTLAATRLRPGAIVHCATDWEPYAENMLEVLTAHPDFENTQADGGFAPRPGFRPLTRFEGQGLDKGHVVNDLLFRRVQHSDVPAVGHPGGQPDQSAHSTRQPGQPPTGA